MAARLKQSPDAAENAKSRATTVLKVLEGIVGASAFVAGPRPTIADCTLFATIEFARFTELPLDATCKNVLGWYERFKERPSAQA
jgi:glutathione S-transferase